MNYQVNLTKFQLFIVFFLSITSLIISFILGILSGKDFASIPESQKIINQQSITVKPEELNFLNNTSNQQTDSFVFDQEHLEKLQKNTKDLQKEEKNQKPQKVNQAKIKKPKSVKMPQRVRGNYTVQVFTSSSRSRANELLNNLKNHGFNDAYLHTYISTDQRTLYRVRVGKTTKDESEKLSKNLENLGFIDQVQIIRL